MKGTQQPEEGRDSHLNADGSPRIVQRTFTVDEDCAGLRIDHYLKRKIPRLSRTKLQRMIRTQLHRTNGRPVKAHSRVLVGEGLILRRQAAPEPPCPRTFGVRFQDDLVMVVDKPAGLPMHASAKFYFNTLTRVLSETYPNQVTQICHRIDRETSGLVVVARDRQAASVLKQAFANRQVKKKYLAIVHGVPNWNEKRIDLPLGLAGSAARISIRMVVRPDALPATTIVRVIAKRDTYSLLMCVPVTGRQHQIRAHLAAVGFPIVGDKLYAHGDDAFAEYCDSGMTDHLLNMFVLHRQALHAAWIEFPHPRGGHLVTVSSPMPRELTELVGAEGDQCRLAGAFINQPSCLDE